MDKIQIMKSRKAEKQKSRKAEKQKSRKAEKQKSTKIRIQVLIFEGRKAGSKKPGKQGAGPSLLP
ncbi:hypothetical protein [Endozoicomonas acroporae]|uniref:hypothetical protein n=1 Tax=Endozoicomonas acroporae TaxID=1701104 RepID=UPI003D79A5C7